MIRREEALAYHEAERPGKIEVRPIKRCLTARDMRLAALPGAGFPCEAIQADPEAVFRYTAKGNLVGIITNGSAVPGLGDVGPLVAKPMLEGAAVLFKRLADLDGFDLELDTRDPDRFVETVRLLEPTFGGINLKDIRAPEGLDIFRRLRDTLRIPVMHENYQSPAVVAAAALMNALDLADKAIADARIVICGAGTVGLGCAEMFLLIGAAPANLFVYDVNGLLHPDRADLNVHQRRLAQSGAPATLDEGLRGADVFVGASAPGVITPAMIRTMARYPVVFALATPEPEIGYEEARASRRDVMVATALTQVPERHRRSPELPVHLPRRPRRARRAHHRRHARGGRARAGRTRARGRGRRGEPRLRLRALELRARVPAAEADRPAHPGPRVGGRGAPGRGRGRGAHPARRGGLPGGARDPARPGARNAAPADGQGAPAAPAHRVLGGHERDHPARRGASWPRRGSRSRCCSARRRRCATGMARLGVDPTGLAIVDPAGTRGATHTRPSTWRCASGEA